LWRRNWLGIAPLFPHQIRNIVYTTDAIESLNMSPRKTIKTRGTFPAEDAALKEMYLALKNLAAQWKAVQGWKERRPTTSRCCGKTASDNSAADQPRNTNQIVYTKYWTLPPKHANVSQKKRKNTQEKTRRLNQNC